MKTLSLSTLLLMVSNIVFATTSPEVNTLFDEQHYFFPVERNTNSTVTKENYLEIQKSIVDLYSENLEKKIIKNNPNWDNGYISAWATFDELSNSYYVNSWGGLARLPNMNSDTFSFVICHEVGHILGGSPKSKLESVKWASAEGQSDHFAASSCLKKYFLLKPYEENLSYLNDQRIEKYASLRCFSQFPDDELKQSVCLRIAYAAQGFASYLSYYNKYEISMSFNEDSLLNVEETNFNGYPEDSCRVHTILNGALCSVDDLDIAPNMCRRLDCWYKN